MKEKFKKYIRPFYCLFRLLFKVNWIKTFYLNFKTQKFTDALKLPIIVYGRLKIYSLQGKIIIDAPIETGMVHIGKDLDHNPVSLNPIKLTINGHLVFKGRALISGGSTITVWSGSIVIGQNVCIGSGVQLKAVSKIEIGEYSRIISLAVIMDTNVHFIKNIETGEIRKSYAPVRIGAYCWLNSGTNVTKGTVIPDYCISARNTFFNKDYSKLCEANTVFAGSPAKVIATKQQRIFNVEKECELNSYFSQNSEEDSYVGEKGVYIEPEDVGSLLRLY